MNKRLVKLLFIIIALSFCGRLFPVENTISHLPGIRVEDGQAVLKFTPVQPFFMKLANMAAPMVTDTQPGNPVSIPVLLIITLAYAALLAAGYFLLQKKSFDGTANKEINFRGLSILFAAGLILRVILAVSFKGHPVDIHNFSAWAIQAADRGLPGFYIGIFADYPPGYIYFLYIIGAIRKIFMLPQDSRLYIIILKLPAIIADLLTAFFIFRHAEKNGGGRQAFVLSALFLFNPAIILNSAVWGQIDSVFTLFILLTLILLIEKKAVQACCFFAAALLIKPQALIFAPLLIFAFIRKGGLRTFLAGAGAGILVFILGIIPFSVIQGPFWIFKKYTDSLALYPYASLNAANLFSLSGGNGMPDSETFLFLPYSIWGFVFIFAVLGWAVFVFLKNKGREFYSYTALFIITAVFILSSRMHERYLYPAIALGLIAFIFTKDKRIFLITGFLSLLHFLNTGYVFQFSLMNSFYVPRFDQFFFIISFLHLTALAWLVKTGYDLFIKNRNPLLFISSEAGIPENNEIRMKQ